MGVGHPVVIIKLSLAHTHSLLESRLHCDDAYHSFVIPNISFILLLLLIWVYDGVLVKRKQRNEISFAIGCYLWNILPVICPGDLAASALVHNNVLKEKIRNQRWKLSVQSILMKEMLLRAINLNAWALMESSVYSIFQWDGFACTQTLILKRKQSCLMIKSTDLWQHQLNQMKWNEMNWPRLQWWQPCTCNLEYDHAKPIVENTHTHTHTHTYIHTYIHTHAQSWCHKMRMNQKKFGVKLPSCVHQSWSRQKPLNEVLQYECKPTWRKQSKR